MGGGSATCAERCQAETIDPISGICSNYDDSNIWCEYYAYWLCVSHDAECTKKPKASKCEAKCDKEASAKTKKFEDMLDSFLICDGDCDRSEKKLSVLV